VTADLVALGGANTAFFSGAQLTALFPELAGNSSITISNNQGSGFPFSSLSVSSDFFRSGAVGDGVTYTVTGSDLDYVIPTTVSKSVQTTVSGTFTNGTNPPTVLTTDIGSVGTSNTKFQTSVSNPGLGVFVPMSTNFSFGSGSGTPITAFTGPTPFSITNAMTFTTSPTSETLITGVTTVSATAAVPEPTSIVLGAFALPLLVFLRRRRAAA
jgi:hypothetical protein